MEATLKYMMLLVRDYDEALSFYTQKLGFVVLEDTPINPEKRWVVIAPSGNSTFGIVLNKIKSAPDHIGHQTAGKVLAVLHTNNIQHSHQQLLANGVRILQAPVELPHGTVLHFEDLYGNVWDLVQPNPQA